MRINGTRLFSAAIFCAFVGISTAFSHLAGAPPGADESAEARALLDKHLAGEPAAKRARIAAVDSVALRRVFGADVHFFSLNFPKYPVAIAPAGGILAPNNLFAISGETVTHLKDRAEVEKFCVSSLPALRDEAAARDAVHGSLLLAQVFFNDGMFQFEEPEASVGAKLESATGTLAVLERNGDKGELTVEIAIAGGKATSVEFGGRLSSGIRPRCQATRLLDPDPAIRAIMRRDILVMGSACKGYLDDQRAKASPELREAIDSVWRQIVAEGR